MAARAKPAASGMLAFSLVYLQLIDWEYLDA
jgi:hypothetical protein